MKAYTDIEESKHLSEILPIESADACWTNHKFNDILSSLRLESTSPTEYKSLLDYYYVQGYLIEPAWSLAALLYVLDFPSLIQNKEDEWEVCVPNHKSDGYIEVSADNPIDACYEMIVKLYEEKLI